MSRSIKLHIEVVENARLTSFGRKSCACRGKVGAESSFRPGNEPSVNLILKSVSLVGQGKRMRMVSSNRH